MRRCEVRVLEGEGHGLMASAPVMGGVLMEIAREWEDVSLIGSLFSHLQYRSSFITCTPSTPQFS